MNQPSVVQWRQPTKDSTGRGPKLVACRNNDPTPPKLEDSPWSFTNNYSIIVDLPINSMVSFMEIFHGVVVGGKKMQEFFGWK